jgi:hypothetical protein
MLWSAQENVHQDVNGSPDAGDDELGLSAREIEESAKGTRSARMRPVERRK